MPSAAQDLLLVDGLGCLSFDAYGTHLLCQVFIRPLPASLNGRDDQLGLRELGLFHNGAAASRSQTGSCTGAFSSASRESPAGQTRRSISSTDEAARRALPRRLGIALTAIAPPRFWTQSSSDRESSGTSFWESSAGRGLSRAGGRFPRLATWCGWLVALLRCLESPEQLEEPD